MKKLLAFLVLAILLAPATRADEGMWLPALIHKLNINDMQKTGLKLSAEDIYSINNSSLKDAIVSIGGCTAEMISPEGLMLTNHHCAYSDIQRHSSVEHDYLQDGFWAKTRDEELPNPSKIARFLISTEDVTEKVMAELNDNMSFQQKQQAISQVSARLEKEAVGDTHYQAQVRSFLESNKYYLFVYETFRDVRLVGAPPQALGKFGGDTDNWMWPRHTADFAIYRVYAGPDGKPASYSKDNVPLKPRHFLPISIKGVKDNDYAMVMGYPGTTNRYKTSVEVQYTMDVTNSVRIDVRAKKLEIIKAYMETSQKARIQYANKHAGSSNYYKYSIGQNQGLTNLDVIAKKKAIEEQFTQWVASSPQRNAKYGKALDMIRGAYENIEDETAQEYLSEALLRGPEIFMFAYRLRALYNLLDKPVENKDRIDQILANVKESLPGYFKDYDAETDRKLTASLTELYANRVGARFQPPFFKTIQTKYKGNFDKYASQIFAKTVFADEAKMNEFLKNPTRKALDKDLAFQAAGEIFDLLRMISEETQKSADQLAEGRHLLVAGLMEMQPDKVFYPDANSTMRLTYGTVGSYNPRDGVLYKETTTVQGYLEKEIPNDDEFHVPARMKELIQARDFGRYADENGDLITCFISNNDITGGNSGSPVINANGELIGCAFDGNWEAMSGDLAFEPEIQRTISVDIRFVLWVVDKYAGATHLIDEMTIVE
ncbi:peptidase S46 [Bacteroidales bacterium 6E]|nr:peptidase S46 [Bacteroidales bacterium 6E]